MNQHVPPNRALAARLAAEIEGEVLFDAASRGRYSTDASYFQIEPVGVIVPKREADVIAAMAIAREHGVSLLPRGGGSSQSGQTVGRSLVMDFSKYLDKIIEVDEDAANCTVQPGIAMDELNRQLKHTGLWFPVDVSTSSRATIGGMTGNNSCGTRSIRYGIMRDNVISIDAILADGADAHFGELAGSNAVPANRLMQKLLALGARETETIAAAFPGVSRRVGGYLIDALAPGDNASINLATLLCGSEGTLAVSKRIKLKLSPQPINKALGICHFPTFRAAMEAAQHIVKLQPVAVEVVDSTLIELARDIAMFRPVMEAHVRGRPAALLLTEFAEDYQNENLRRLDRLDELMGDLGHANAVVKVADSAQQKAVWAVRAAGLNIMMSMKSAGKPVSFIEDCAVPLEHLADYTERLTEVFARHGTTGTWYAHASVGCLHVRPVLNLKLEKDAATMRAIAEEAFAMVREYKGAHSGEHGDGLVRSEFHEPMYGRKVVELFEEVKDLFDPAGIMNPGKIVRPSRMDDRRLFRYKADYSRSALQPALDWSAYEGGASGLQGAVEMCNNNGECRSFNANVMCPSFRATRNEQDLTRGRANSLRLALSGQLGPDAIAADDMLATMKHCVSCKACRRECPTGVDMAKMKIEVLHAAGKRRGLSPHDRLVAFLPRYAPYAARLAPLMNLRDKLPGAAKLSERLAGFTARRTLPQWHRRPFDMPQPLGPAAGREVALFADTFDRYFEPDNLHAAAEVLAALGYRVDILHSPPGEAPLCCGRTYLSAGLVDEARAAAKRFLAATAEIVARGVPIIGLEPSCLFTLKDEFPAMLTGEETARLAANAMLFEQFMVGEVASGRLTPPFGRLSRNILLHGHCHQKSFDAMGAVGKALSFLGGAKVTPIESSCCGMAGSYGYGAETYDTSMKMAEAALLPAVRAAETDALIAADGFSCRHQIADGSGREAIHVAQIYRLALRERAAS